MKKTYDVNVKDFIQLISPASLKNELPMSEASTNTVLRSRDVVKQIIEKGDPRLLVIAGPCSIHDVDAAVEYAQRLLELQHHVKDRLYLVMRVYFEKPRTTVGWKGLINDPHLDGRCDINAGLRIARRLMLDITAAGMPIGTELLDPITPQYIAGLVSWAAIGARTTESQTHREMASGLSMPVGFKNSTDGDLDTALNAMIAAGAPQHFLGIDANGQTSIVQTTGNAHAHIVLRGGHRPNYDTVSIRDAQEMLLSNQLTQAVVVDCSHANSRKHYPDQAVVWRDVVNQRLAGNHALIGLMLESNLHEGQQKNTGDLQTLQQGVSITDACISWETTEALIMEAYDQLK